MKLLHKKLDKDIIQQETDHDQDEIAEELHPPMKGGFSKYNIAHQEKTRGEADAEGNDDRCYMRGHGQGAKVHVVFVEDEMIAYRVHDDIQHGIAASTGCITEGLQRHGPAERRIKKINKSYDPLFRYLFHSR